MNPTLGRLLAVLLTPGPLLAVVLSDETFTASDGGYTIASTGAAAAQPWTYASATGSWTIEGDTPGVTSHSLTGPAITVPTDRPLRISIVHRHSFEVEWDGGVFQISIGGGAFTTIPRSAFLQNGYNYTALKGNHPLKGVDAFNGDSDGHSAGTMITSIAEVPAVTPGSTVAVRILGAWDENTIGSSPNWEIDSVKVETLVDTDGDGMYDLWETEHGLNPNSPADRDTDADADGMTNFREFELRADPHDNDSDDDGLFDGIETGTGTFVNTGNRGTSPTRADSDGDSFADPVENPLLPTLGAAHPGTDPNLADTDTDGYRDDLEVLYSTANPRNAGSQPLRNGLLDLLAYWNFNTTTNPTEALDTVKGFPGALENTTAYTADGEGRSGLAGDAAIDFGPVGREGNAVLVAQAGFLSIAAHQNQIAVSFWQRLDAVVQSSSFWGDSPSAGGSRGINGHATWNDNSLYWDTNGCCDGGNRISGPVGIDLIAPTAWHHFVFQKNGNAKEVWVDGVRTVSGSNTNPLNSDFTVLHIGSDAGSANIAGRIDDFAVFGDALTPEQIAQLAGGASPPSLVPPSTDTDGDGMLDAYETANGLNPNLDDSLGDLDADGLTNFAEFTRGTKPNGADSDDDALADNIETGTGTWAGLTNRGTDPLKVDTDGDGLNDNIENNSGTFVDAANPGTNPNQADTDGDTWPDSAEIPFGSNPNVAASVPALTAGLDILAYWPFNDSNKPLVATDIVHNITADLVNGAAYSPDAGGRSGVAGDKALDLGTSQGAQAARILNAPWLNLASSADTLSVSYWQNLVQVTNSSSLWFTSPSSNNGERGFQVHSTWGDGNIYFDTAGCCDGTQRINASAGIDLVGTWHHFVAQKTGATKEVWMDGVLTVSGSNDAVLPSDFTRLYIGSAVESNSTVGLIDDFAIMGDFLTEAQILRLAAGEPPTALLGPAAPLAIQAFSVNAANHTVQITWSSEANVIYTLEGSRTMGTGSWIEINDNIPSGGATTSFTYDVNLFPPGGSTPPVLFLRVVKP